MFRSRILRVFVLVVASAAGELYSPDSWAQGILGCEITSEGIQIRMRDYVNFRERNQESLRNLMDTERDCHKEGEALSWEIAKATEAKACEVEGDAASMNARLTKLGDRCERHFKKLNQLQVELRERFTVVRDDVLLGSQIMDDNSEFQEFCAGEVAATKKLVENFLVLEGGIVSVEARSVDGKVNYGRFRDITSRFRDTTSGRNLSCGEIAGNLMAAFQPLSEKAGKGSLPPKPGGKHARDASDVTGELKDNLLKEAGTAPNSLGAAFSAAKGPLVSAGGAYSAKKNVGSVPQANGSGPEPDRDWGKIGFVPEGHLAGADSKRKPAGLPESAGAAIWSSVEQQDDLALTVESASATDPGHSRSGEALVAASAAGSGRADQSDASGLEADRGVSLFERIHRYYRTRTFEARPAN